MGRILRIHFNLSFEMAWSGDVHGRASDKQEVNILWLILTRLSAPSPACDIN